VIKKDSSRPIVVKSDEKQIVMGVVYAPGQIDTDGETMTVEAIEKMAYDFMMHKRLDHIDYMHNCEKSGSLTVESFIAREGDPDFPAGSWVMAVKVFDPSIWSQIKKGEINGFSFYGKATPIPKLVPVRVSLRMKGDTESSTGGPLPPHSHELEIQFTPDSTLIPTFTKMALGHRHYVFRTTATESEIDHAHRIVLA
jgi:hypothetical protein